MPRTPTPAPGELHFLDPAVLARLGTLEHIHDQKRANILRFARDGGVMYRAWRMYLVLQHRTSRTLLPVLNWYRLPPPQGSRSPALWDRELQIGPPLSFRRSGIIPKTVAPVQMAPEASPTLVRAL